MLMSKEHYLLDTMTILWFAFHPRRLPRTVREVLLDEATYLGFSTVSLWEIGLKMSVGGYTDFKLPNDWELCIPGGLKQQGITLLTIEPEHCRRIQDFTDLADEELGIGCKRDLGSRSGKMNH